MSDFASILNYAKLNWLQLVVAAFMLLMLLCGYKKGLIRMSVSLVSMLLSAVLTKILHPYVLAWMQGNATLRAMVQKRVAAIFAESAVAAVPGAADSGLSVGTDTAAVQVDNLYRLLGLDHLSTYLSEQLTGLIMTALCFLVLLVLVNLVVRIVFYILDLIMRLPGLSLMNRLSGAALGLVEAVFYVWVLLILAAILPDNALTACIAEQFSREGSWLCYLKEANLLVRIFTGIIG